MSAEFGPDRIIPPTLALTSGTKLGPYEIQSAVGAGGMGEVYRARDTRLDRTVAVKILAPHLSSSELKQRLEREARAISALNHPHICHLYDVGSQEGIDYLVMEFVEGESLAERLQRGALPMPEILKIGADICEALETAHRRGIIHRDLKPANIMLTKSGAKLMDFGLAKPLGMESAAAAVPSFTAAATLTSPSPVSPLTTAGTIVGTIQYMSPEQIEGREADVRCDIFALGTVFYEAATGKRAFEGKSQLSVASSILEREPEPMCAAKPLTPPAFERLVKTCLQKNPDERFQSAHDIKLELKWIAESQVSPDVTVAAESSRHRARLAWAAALLLAVALGVLVGFLVTGSSTHGAIVRSMIVPPENVALRLVGDFAGPPVLSPDGTYLAFAAANSSGQVALWVRPMNSFEAHALQGTEGAMFPFWSPDSRSLAFFGDGKLKVIDREGSAAVAICDAPQGRGGTWGPDGVILFTPDTQLPIMRVSAAGGTATPVTHINSAQHTSHRWPYFLPDGKHFLYFALNHDASKAANDAVYFASLDGKEERPLFRSLSSAIFADGFVLFARDNQLFAQAVDPGNGKLSGAPQHIASGIANDLSTWHVDVSASRTGLLVVGGGGSTDSQLVWVDRSGNRVGTIADKLPNLQMAELAPQDDRVALQIDTGTNDLWVLDIARGIRTRLTFGPVTNAFPKWSPDGRWIAYALTRGGKYYLARKSSDGSGDQEILLEEEHFLQLSQWSPDGKYLIYGRGPFFANGEEIWAMPLEGDRKPIRLVTQGAGAFAADGKMSPNGKWLAYVSNESGQLQIYVVPFPGGQGRWQVSQNGGVAPKWSHDGKEFYYATPNYSIFSVPVSEVGNAIQFGTTKTLASNSTAQQFFYDVSRDGSKILLGIASSQGNPSIALISNWSAELKR